MDTEDQEWLRLGVAATMARQFGEDQRAFVESLATYLEQALPDRARVLRRRASLIGQRQVRELTVEFGDDRYLLTVGAGGSLSASRTLTKRGIALSTREMPVPEWITELCGRLEELALENQAAADALQRAAP